MTVPNRRAFVSMASGVLLVAAKSAVTGRAMAQTSLVGTYDGRQMEMAAGLELLANGRSHGHVRGQGSGLGVHGQFSSRWFGSKV